MSAVTSVHGLVPQMYWASIGSAILPCSARRHVEDRYTAAAKCAVRGHGRDAPSPADWASMNGNASEVKS